MNVPESLMRAGRVAPGRTAGRLRYVSVASSQPTAVGAAERAETFPTTLPSRNWSVPNVRPRQGVRSNATYASQTLPYVLSCDSKPWFLPGRAAFVQPSADAVNWAGALPAVTSWGVTTVSASKQRTRARRTPAAG